MELRSELARKFIDVVRHGDEYGREPLRAATQRTYENALLRVESVMEKPFEAWTYNDMDELFKRLHDLGMRGTTIRGLGNILRVMFRWGLDSGNFTGANPMRALPKTIGPAPDLVIVSPDQAKDLIEAIEMTLREKRDNASALAMRIPSMDDRFIEKYTLLFEFSYYSGISLQELLSVKKANVEATGIWLSRMRSGKELRRFVSVPKIVLRDLRQYMAEHPLTDYVFYGESGLAHEGSLNKPMGSGQAYNVFAQARDLAGLPKSVTPKSWSKAYQNWLNAQDS